MDTFIDGLNGDIGSENNLLNKDKSSSTTESAQLVALEQRVNQLEFVCEALWQIVKQAENLEDNFLTTVKNDVMSAVREKKEAKIQCTQCKLKIPQTHAKCFYCGAPVSSTEE